MTLIDELASGPVDLIGDVHGEIEPLEALLKTLGYSPGGQHPEGRRLVFVGDLTDRGPDSPAVVRLVRGMVEAGRAQAVAGNHELNILRRDPKDGNAWFFGERDELEPGVPTQEVLADERIRDEAVAFFETLPLALERDDLRVVHACWDDDHVDALRSVSRGSLLSYYQTIEEQLEARVTYDVIDTPAPELRDPQSPPPPSRPHAELSVRAQNHHPVKVLTSGKEHPADQPFWAGGRWRLEERTRWWRDYQGPMVIVGHYWRCRVPGMSMSKGSDPFEGHHPEEPLGRGDVMCIDYSIGKRPRERATGGPYHSALGAYRWPERQLVFSD